MIFILHVFVCSVDVSIYENTERKPFIHLLCKVIPVDMQSVPKVYKLSRLIAVLAVLGVVYFLSKNVTRAAQSVSTNQHLDHNLTWDQVNVSNKFLLNELP